MKNIDKYRGCLLGGACGDALGYVIEFLDDASIFKKFGKKGITKYDLKNGIAQISDDTQMTMFTANGLLLGTTRSMTHDIIGTYTNYIYFCYKDWLLTQTEKYPLKKEPLYSWLINEPELFNCRAPGNTCLSALGSGTYGTIEQPINTSKGCGGIMRVAPIGLYFEGKQMSIEEIDRIGAESAALTHGHELGYIPAAALVHIIHLISHNDDITISDAVMDMKESISKQFSSANHLPELIALIDKAIELSKKNINDIDAIKELGQGWVAEETLAIAIYCSLKYCNDFDKALIASVNHSGDSDSTGAVTGNILGAYLGLEGIPKKYSENLELKQVITELADDLYNDCAITEYVTCKDKIWEQKYIEHSYHCTSDAETSNQESTTIILFPEFQQLKHEVEKLRVELTIGLLERDELELVICKNIATQYILKFGSLEYKVYEAQCTVLRLKRKIDLIQSKKNRQEKISLLEIEKVLDDEFSEYQKILEEKVNDMNGAIERSKLDVMTPEQTKELKKMYHTIVKELHPDLHPNITKAQEQLLKNAIIAYENGDLKTIKIISEMVNTSDLPKDDEDVMSHLSDEKKRLTNLLNELKESIEKIKNRYPYSVKELVENEKKSKEYIMRLQEMLEQYKSQIKFYTQHINELLR